MVSEETKVRVFQNPAGIGRNNLYSANCLVEIARQPEVTIPILIYWELTLPAVGGNTCQVL
jgi:hypothetical protein